MADITTQQLAQLLLGIARAQNAMAEALENSKVGFKSTHFRPAVETAARIRANRPETLADYPSRLLLQMLGRFRVSGHRGPRSTRRQLRRVQHSTWHSMMPSLSFVEWVCAMKISPWA